MNVTVARELCTMATTAGSHEASITQSPLPAGRDTHCSTGQARHEMARLNKKRHPTAQKLRSSWGQVR
jgi:hypothetical protein